MEQWQSIIESIGIYENRLKNIESQVRRLNKKVTNMVKDGGVIIESVGTFDHSDAACAMCGQCRTQLTRIHTLCRKTAHSLYLCQQQRFNVTSGERKEKKADKEEQKSPTKKNIKREVVNKEVEEHSKKAYIESSTSTSPPYRSANYRMITETSTKTKHTREISTQADEQENTKRPLNKNDFGPDGRLSGGTTSIKGDEDYTTTKQRSHHQQQQYHQYRNSPTGHHHRESEKRRYEHYRRSPPKKQRRYSKEKREDRRTSPHHRERSDRLRSPYRSHW